MGGLLQDFGLMFGRLVAAPTCSGAAGHVQSFVGVLTIASPPTRAAGDLLYTLYADETSNTSPTVPGWSVVEDTPSLFAGSGRAAIYGRVATNDASDAFTPSTNPNSNGRSAYMVNLTTLATTRPAGELGGALGIKPSGSGTFGANIPALTPAANGYEVMLTSSSINTTSSGDVSTPVAPVAAGWASLANSHVRATGGSKVIEGQAFIRPAASGVSTGVVGPTFTAPTGPDGATFIGVGVRVVFTP